jgi:hypothetical protein
MAATTPPAAGSAPAPKTTYDVGRMYDVKLARVVEYPVGSGNRFSPRDQHKMSGAMCQGIADDIVSATLV